MRYIFIVAFMSLLISCSTHPQQAATDTAQTLFTNPLIAHGADPWVTQDEGYYYYCFSRGKQGVFITQASAVTDLPNAEPINAWTPPEGTAYSAEIWAPELHKINQRWYIYVAADDGQNKNHRMHVLASKGSTIESGFEYVGQMKDPDDTWAIDGTVFTYQDKLYFIWSGWEGDENVAQHLYIAPMASPTEISGNRVKLSSPEYAWEIRGTENGGPKINEGPEVLQHDGKTYLIYSASGSWSNDYCLGMLSLTGTDPMDAKAWVKSDQPVFAGTDCVISPGHCSFIQIGHQDWIVYHVTGGRDGGWDSRYVKMQPFFWDAHGPVFGKPAEDGVLFPIPMSG